MAKQKIEIIKVNELLLWSENPRDPIDLKSTDYEIMKRALADNPSKWDLQKLANEMGSHYDLSELPTVVNNGDKYVVYDGNRRIALLKYLQNETLYASFGGGLFYKFEPRELKELVEIPCNVCDEDTALTNIERKHSTNGSWGILERDYFLNVHRGYEKSTFLMIDEQTELITNNPSLNKRFVKDEVLTKKNLNEIGFDVDQERGIISSYSKQDAKEIIEKIPALINDKHVTTRDNRGELKSILLDKFPELKKKLAPYDVSKTKNVLSLQGTFVEKKTRKTRPTKMTDELFGKTLVLNPGMVNNLYCALVGIDEKTRGNDAVLPFLGMALRLLIEIAARIYYVSDASDQIAERFLKETKKMLKQSDKNYISLTNEWLSDKINLNGLLQKYAHGNIVCTRSDILTTSKIVADILEHHFVKKL